MIHVPAWDCPPYDRIPPSRRVMGVRLSAASALADAAGPRLVIAGVEAAVQRLPSATDRSLVVTAGELVEPERLLEQLGGFGYSLEDRVDDPGEVALRAQVIDLYPADGELPFRIGYDDARVTEIRSYDPLTQRSVASVDALTIRPALEPRGADDARTDLLAALPDAVVVEDAEIGVLREQVLAEVRAAFESLPVPEGEHPVAPDRLFLDEQAWSRGLAGRQPVVVADQPPRGVMPTRATRSALLDFVRAMRAEDRRIGLSGPVKPRQALLRALARSGERAPEAVADWHALRRLPPGTLALLDRPMEAGFVGDDAAVLAPADILGPRGLPDGGRVETGLQPTLRPGDAIVHSDEGVGVLRGIETVEGQDLLRIDYAGDETLMVPAGELHRVWRYGGEASGVTLDRVGGETWAVRRASVEAEIGDLARRLVAVARERDGTSAPSMEPDRSATQRFNAGFAFGLTLDQAAAIEAVTADLASGRPMDRLVCGDVGFGKTEVALRATAIAAFCGWQVAVVAPTTVLARQHAETFARRFARTGVAVAMLSRLTPASDAKRVREGVADGSIGVAIGTHSLAAKGVRFKRLGLLIIDEEQHFGTRQKTALAKLRQGVHLLTLTATPIPRTLHAALAGLQSLSVIATPPMRRQPVRAVRLDVDSAVIGQALRRERRRGGQSFVVCPRVDDIAMMRARLEAAAPELRIIEAHGAMEPDALEEAMVRFAGGDGDVLLATNIIEAGLDVPRANTMLVWRPDRFGLAQLHQLRGRVGRGRLRGTLLLLTDPGVRLTRAATARLDALEANERLGAGFAISARDLDLRGAGDLLGEAQAGHVKLIGIELTQHLLEQALQEARGETPVDAWTPELTLGARAFLPADYVADADLRVELHVRLSRIADADEVDGLEEEIEDRFGSPPPPVLALLELARLRLTCRLLGVAVLDVGPAGGAMRLRSGVPEAVREPLAVKGERVVLARASADEAGRIAVAREMLALL